MSIFTLWLLITVLPNLSTVLTMVSVVGLLFAGFGFAIGFAQRESNRSYGDEDKDYIFGSELMRVAGRALLVFLVVTSFACVIPSKEDIQYIVGGYFVTNIDGLEKLPPNLVKSANKFLEDYATESETEDNHEAD